MLTQTQEQILAFLLSNTAENITIRGIAKKLGKSYTLVYNNIADLEKKNIIKKQSVPPAQIITLNEFAPNDLFVGIELNRKKEFLKKHLWAEVMLNDILSSTKKPFFIILIFGSYAKGTATAHSDLDLLIILQDKKDVNYMDNIARNVYTKVKKGLNFIDINDFNEMIKNPNKLNIGNEARKHHIILYGVEAYYQMLNIIKK